MCLEPMPTMPTRHTEIWTPLKWCKTQVFCTFSLPNVLLATAACNFSTSELQKVVRTCSVLYILTWKCASRYSGVQFFNIATSKSAPRPSVFYDFDFKIFFSLQRCAIFQHLNFKKCSEPVSFLTFWLQNVLLATAACNFSFLRSATCRFTEVTFRPSRTTNHWKNTAFRDFSNIWRGWIFFLLTFALLHLLSSDSTSLLCFFHLLTLLLCSAFSTVHIVGSLLFKLPLIIYIYIYIGHLFGFSKTSGRFRIEPTVSIEVFLPSEEIIPGRRETCLITMVIVFVP